MRSLGDFPLGFLFAIGECGLQVVADFKDRDQVGVLFDLSSSLGGLVFTRIEIAKLIVFSFSHLG